MTLQDYIKLAEESSEGLADIEHFITECGDYFIPQLKPEDAAINDHLKASEALHDVRQSLALFPPMAKALIEAEEALRKAQRCLTIYQQADVALDLNAALSQIQSLNGGGE